MLRSALILLQTTKQNKPVFKRMRWFPKKQPTQNPWNLGNATYGALIQSRALLNYEIQGYML